MKVAALSWSKALSCLAERHPYWAGRWFKRRPISAGILALPIHDDQLHAEFLFEEPFLLAVPENH